MKKYLFILLILTLPLLFYSYKKDFSYATTLPQNVRIIYNSTGIYSTTDIFDLTQEELESVTLMVANFHDEFEVVGEEIFLNYQFYEVKISQDQNGFLLKSTCLDTEILSPQKTFEPNGKVIVTSNLFYIQENQYVQLENIVLLKDTEIRILDGYDTSKQYTQISFQNEDEILIYYILTQNIQGYGINYSVILAITLIVIGLSLTFLLTKFVKPKQISKN